MNSIIKVGMKTTLTLGVFKRWRKVGMASLTPTLIVVIKRLMCSEHTECRHWLKNTISEKRAPDSRHNACHVVGSARAAVGINNNGCMVAAVNPALCRRGNTGTQTGTESVQEYAVGADSRTKRLCILISALSRSAFETDSRVIRNLHLRTRFRL